MKRLLWIVVIAAMTVAAPPAHAQKTRVSWTEISMPREQARPELVRHLRQVVMGRAKRMDWGRHDGRTLEAKIEVTEFSVVTRDGVVRVTCAGQGRVSVGRASRMAKSRFSMGARPAQKAALERQLLAMLGRGLVTRLADIAKSWR
jgi:hypothetical protein